MLFQIELIIGKIFLPNYGGSYFVWGACIVFFQAALFFGYAFSHFVIRWLGIAKYRILHIAIIFFPFLFFPGKTLPLMYSLTDLPIVVDVFIKLLVTIGPVFIVLSTIGIVSQSWVANSNLPQKNNPYVLFGISNFGSFLALMTYPFLFENYYDLSVQVNIWRISYCILAVLQLIAFAVIKLEEAVVEKERPFTISKRVIVEWCLYSAASVILFLAVTNVLVLEIAPMPFLWIMPLAIYLLSFVLNFKEKPFFPKFIDKYAYLNIGFGVLFYFVVSAKAFPVLIVGVSSLVFLFFICMTCQSRLYLSRPKDTRELTYFYLIMSFSGFLGGLFATWIVPVFANNHLEFLIGLFMLCLAINISKKDYSVPFGVLVWVFVLALLLYSGRIFLLKFHYWGILLLLVVVWVIFFSLKKRAFGLSIALFILVILANNIEMNWLKGNCIYQMRNYYGIIKVLDIGKVRFMLNGKTIHGAQALDAKGRQVPIAYYNPASPVVKLMLSVKELKRIGIIGLGTGSLSVYTNKDQYLDFFELDKDIIDVAKKYFVFLNIAQGKIKYYVGDARKSLESLDRKGYNLIVVDAFSGDSIPTHLLTKEGINVFRDHLGEKGIIVFHATNQYINVVDPLVSTAFSLGAKVLYKNNVDVTTARFFSEWVAVTWEDEAAKQLSETFKWEELDQNNFNDIRVWTDNYTNILPHLDTDKILKSVTSIKMFPKPAYIK
ncbi:MAG: fused MFS/spermidine synthase [Candidatus Omnitrophica bacterium]|nr:fused MFS/spermidine synthase [Candidatus Omnitrophota bacterium]MBU4334502.1 fused MFS/spermidine synthase [Candidatus Omnitrophota bacterium]